QLEVLPRCPNTSGVHPGAARYPHAMRRRRSIAAALLVLLAGGGCRTGRKYVEHDGPRYTGGLPAVVLSSPPAQSLRVVSFNIERALRVERAIGVMTAEPALRDADILLLQEMDEAGTRQVADAFGMGYVYYPGTFSLKTQRDFGNAVLSRWPIVSDAKVLLPHLGALGQLQRTATAATVQVGPSLVRVYSTHLGTLINATPAA